MNESSPTPFMTVKLHIYSTGPFEADRLCRWRTVEGARYAFPILGTIKVRRVGLLSFPPYTLNIRSIQLLESRSTGMEIIYTVVDL